MVSIHSNVFFNSFEILLFPVILLLDAIPLIEYEVAFDFRHVVFVSPPSWKKFKMSQAHESILYLDSAVIRKCWK